MKFKRLGIVITMGLMAAGLGYGNDRGAPVVEVIACAHLGVEA